MFMKVTTSAICAIALIGLTANVRAQSSNQNKKTNQSLEQLKDVNRSSQGAAGTTNLEKAKVKSGENIDTPTKPAVRAGTTTPRTQQQAIDDYKKSGRPTGESQIQAIAKKKIVVPEPGKTQASTPATQVRTSSTTAQGATVKPAAGDAKKSATINAATKPNPTAAATKPATATVTPKLQPAAKPVTANVTPKLQPATKPATSNVAAKPQPAVKQTTTTATAPAKPAPVTASRSAPSTFTTSSSPPTTTSSTSSSKSTTTSSSSSSTKK